MFELRRSLNVVEWTSGEGIGFVSYIRKSRVLSSLHPLLFNKELSSELLLEVKKPFPENVSPGGPPGQDQLLKVPDPF